MYLSTLRAEMARHRVKVKDISRLLQLSESATNNKLSGRTSLYLYEAVRIWELLKGRGATIGLDDLFNETNNGRAAQ